MTILKLNKLTVRFGGLTAVHDIDCAVDERDIYSVIGPNGAGKTTVFNAITGIHNPTSGTVEFRGRSLERQFTWHVAVRSVVAGLLTGVAAALLAIDVNGLWRATIKRNYAGPGEPFSYAAVWRDAASYVRGELAIEPARGGRWVVRSADGRRALGYADSREKAEAMRENFAQLLRVADYSRGPTASHDYIVRRGDRWAIRDFSDQRDLATLDSREDAEVLLRKYADMVDESAARRRDASVAFLLGALLGTTGAWTVWNRSRRTPEVISRAGIARTFQNIRLFQNMTVLENVLTAMDRRLRGGVLRMALQTPRVRREEADARRRAIELLTFVGLGERAGELAKNLPYGDQRRLEIARALATEPQLVLLDEPAAGMNPTEAVELNQLIERIRARGLTVMLIEHHMRVVMGISDRIAVLDYGEKIAEGTPDEVRANPQVIAAYLGSEEVH